MLITEIATNNRINIFDSFLLKTTYDNIKYQIDKGKYQKAMDEETILESKPCINCFYLNSFQELPAK